MAWSDQSIAISGENIGLITIPNFKYGKNMSGNIASARKKDSEAGSIPSTHGVAQVDY